MLCSNNIVSILELGCDFYIRQMIECFVIEWCFAVKKVVSLLELYCDCYIWQKIRCFCCLTLLHYAAFVTYFLFLELWTVSYKLQT